MEVLTATYKHLQNALNKQTELFAKDESPLLLHITIPVEERDPLAVLERINSYSEQFYWEKPDFDIAIAAGGIAYEPDLQKHSFAYYKERTINASSLNHSLATPIVLGGQTFNPGAELDNEWRSFGQQRTVVPKWTFIKNGNLSLLSVNVAIDPEEDIHTQYDALTIRLQGYLKCLTDFNQMFDEPKQLTVVNRLERSYKEWENAIENARDLIRQGEFDKIVLARSSVITTDRDISPTKFANRLRNQYPDCYTFIFQFEQQNAFVGATPERLVSFHNRYVLTEALAGSINRGTSAREDDQLEHELTHSMKDRSEHRYVIDSIVDQLKNVSTNIQFDEEPTVKKVSNVQHLHTPITAWLKSESDIVSIVNLLHPTPAVGGLPADKALPVIPKLEKMNRGWYAAPVGWFTFEESGEFVVAIRSGLIQKNKATLYAGCGIVEDSDPKKEWEETKLKLIPMLTAIKDA